MDGGIGQLRKTSSVLPTGMNEISPLIFANLERIKDIQNANRTCTERE